MNNRIFVVVVLFLMWLVFMGFMYLKADEITKDPCGVCARSMGEAVVCSFKNSQYPITKTFWPNLSESDNTQEVAQGIRSEKANITIYINASDVLIKSVIKNEQDK